MTLKKYLVWMSVLTVFCWLFWVYVLYSINPEITNWIGFSLFYITLFVCLLGTAALIGFVIRFIALKQHLAFRLVADAFRQSFFFSFLIIASLFLLSQDLFSWLNLILLILGFSVLEYLLVSFKKT